MKNWLLGIWLVLGTATLSHGQAWIQLWNYGNNDMSSTATSNGQYWIDEDGPGSGAPVIMDYNVNANWFYLNINLYAGPDAGNLTLVYTSIGYELADNIRGYFSLTWPGGNFGAYGPIDITIPSVPPNGTVYLRQQVWFGTDPDFTTAVTSGAPFAEVDWLNPSGGDTGVGVPTLPQSFLGMPATILTSPIPEPGTVSLIGVGLAWVFTARRRK